MKKIKRNYMACCRKCKTTKRLNAGEEHQIWNGKPLVRCEGPNELGLACNTQMTIRPIQGTVTDHVCNSKCMASKGPVCECSCGGANHGRNYG